MTEPIIGGIPLSDLEKIYEWRDENIQLKIQLEKLKTKNTKMKEKNILLRKYIKEYQEQYSECMSIIEIYRKDIQFLSNEFNRINTKLDGIIEKSTNTLDMINNYNEK